MIRRSWRTQLKGTATQQGVLTVVHHFLEEWSPQEIQSLPPGAWPDAITCKADLVQHALSLGALHADFEGHGESLARLQEMLLFFTHASVRISHLAAGAQVSGVQAHPAQPGMGTRDAVTGDEG